MSDHLLIVDDEVSILRALERFFTEKGYQVSTCDNAERALEILGEKSVDLALLDLKIGHHDGIELIVHMQKKSPETTFMIMTGFGSIETAIQAVKAGAFHYITKPFEFSDLLNLVEKALEHQKIHHENSLLKRQLKDKYGFENIIGVSEAIKKIFDLIRRVADTDSTILVLGESGTGKELVARAIHYNSQRANRPLIPVNCGAIPENLLESELFGHVKGAFTGAVMTRVGRFEMADHGTLFLDEIGEMSPHLQVKLLRVLQERRFEPVGSGKTMDANVRIIAATNKDLEASVRDKSFREDLFYRLNVIPITIPPLRDRPEDIPILTRFFLKKFSQEHEVEAPYLNEECLRALFNYGWPGNVRELENLIERIVILSHGQEVTQDLLPKKMAKAANNKFVGEVQIPEGGISFKNVVNHFENELILKALEKTAWNKNKAATLLKLNRTTLVEKMKKRQLEKTISN